MKNNFAMIANKLWSYHVNEPVLGIELIKNSGSDQTDIIAYGKGGTLLILSADGKLLFEDQVTEGSSIWCANSIDIDNDGKQELLLGALDGLLRAFKINADYKLEPIWAHRFGASISGVLVDDINSDGTDEIIAYSLDKTIRILNKQDGKMVWGQIFEQGVGEVKIWEESTNPSKKFLIGCGNDGTLRVFDGKVGNLNWFKRYSDKIRSLSILNSKNEAFVACGGDDKQLHVINLRTTAEVKTLQFQDYVWKCASYPTKESNNLLVSTYSFAYFDESIPIEQIKFTSKLVSFNDKIEENWALNEVNIETFTFFEKNDKTYVVCGTTRGEIFILDAFKGNILAKFDNLSCVNAIRVRLENYLLTSSHDNGDIYAFKIDQ